jgi:hypothetical protein
MSKTHVEKARAGNGRGRGRPSLDKFETGREAFERIASGRVNRIIGRLNGLAKLSSGRSKYGYTDKDVEHIRKALIEGVNASCDRLRRQPAHAEFHFDQGEGE